MAEHEMRAAICRLSAAGEHVAGYVTAPEALDAMAKWRIEAIRATAIAFNMDPDKAVQDYVKSTQGAS